MTTRPTLDGDAPDALEAAVRTMLDRRARDVTISPDARERLLARLAGQPPLVVHLGRPVSRAPHDRWRFAPVAATLVLAAGATALVVAARTGSDGATTAPTDSRAAVVGGSPTPAPSDGQLAFDPATAEPVHEHPAHLPPLDIDGVVDEYLGIWFDGSPVRWSAEPATSTGDGLATARWTTHAGDQTYRGTVYLRATDGEWVVVGATTDGLAIAEVTVGAAEADVSYRASAPEGGHRLRFQLAIDDLIHEQWAPVDDGTVGEATRLPLVLDGTLPPGTRVQFRAHHVDGGQPAVRDGLRAAPLSLTDFWVPEPVPG